MSNYGYADHYKTFPKRFFLERAFMANRTEAPDWLYALEDGEIMGKYEVCEFTGAQANGTFAVWFQQQSWNTKRERVRCPHCEIKFKFTGQEGSQISSMRSHAAGRDAAHRQLAQDLEALRSLRADESTGAQTASDFDVWFRHQSWNVEKEKVQCPHCVSKFKFTGHQGSQVSSMRGHAAGHEDAAHLQLAQDLEALPGFRAERYTEVQWQAWFEYIQGMVSDCAARNFYIPSEGEGKEYNQFMKMVYTGRIKDLYRDSDGHLKDFYIAWAAYERCSNLQK
jgi:Zn finger protein HypA/HybF involved in hydrogenase expression